MGTLRRTLQVALIGGAMALGAATTASAAGGWQMLDRNADGWTETAAIDADGDGLYDTAYVDSDRDGAYDLAGFQTRGDARFDWAWLRHGKAELWFANRDGDASFELLYVDGAGDGRYEAMYYDADANGYYEWVMLDRNGDGTADTWASNLPASPPTASRRTTEIVTAGIVTLGQLRQLDPFRPGR